MCLQPSLHVLQDCTWSWHRLLQVSFYLIFYDNIILITLIRNVPLTKLPIALNSSKLFILRLENNGLRWIEPQLLQNTGKLDFNMWFAAICNHAILGLYRLHISDNPLPEMPDDSLMGLERSLWELALQRDRLTTVPNRAIRYLRKLRLLDLTGIIN